MISRLNTENNYFRLKAATVVFCFALLSALYSFVLIDGTYCNLDGDACNVGSLLYRDVYCDIFAKDPILNDFKQNYLPTHMLPLKFLLKRSGSLIFSFRILLFFQVFLTLCFTAFMFKYMFRRIGFFLATVISLFVVFNFVRVPVMESVGFSGIMTAWARSTYGIFLPLLLAGYWKIFSDKGTGSFFIGAFFLFTAAALIFHPFSGIYVFFLFSFHYLVTRWRLVAKNKRMLFFRAECVFLLGLIYIFIYKGLVCGKGMNWGYSFTMELLYFPFFLKPVFSWYGIEYFLRLLTFPPYIFTFFMVIYVFCRNRDFFRKERMFYFLASLFSAGFLLHVFAGFFLKLFRLAVDFRLDNVFMRGGRILFWILEILAFYLIWRARSLKLPVFIRLGGVVSIIFLLFFSSGTKLELHGGYFDPTPFMPGAGLAARTLILRGVAVLVMLLIFLVAWLRLIPLKKADNLVASYFMLNMFIWPLICGGLKDKAGEILNNLYGVGAWHLSASVTGNSENLENIKDFELLSHFLSENTTRDDFLLYLVDDTKGHKLKLAVKRAGFGDRLEFMKNSALLRVIDGIYKSIHEKKSLCVPKDIIEKYGITHIVAGKDILRSEVPEPSASGYEIIYENNSFYVFAVKNYEL